MRDTIVVVVVRPCVVPLSNSHSNRSLPASGTHRPSRPSRYPPTSSAERSGMHEPPTHVFVWMDGLVICCFFSPRLTRSRRVWYPPRTTPTTSYPCPAEICYDNRNPRQVDRQRSTDVVVLSSSLIGLGFLWRSVRAGVALLRHVEAR